MPGAMILINAIQSLTLHPQLLPPSCVLDYVLLIALILLTSWLFARTHHLWAMLVTSGVIVFVMLPVSFFMFKHGRWLDFAIPLVVVQLHHMVAQFEEALERHRKVADGNSE